jgi:hypothetical protein
VNVQVIGDELHVDGQVVALLATRNVPASLMDRVVRGLDGAVLGDIPDDTGQPEQVGTTGVITPSNDEDRDPLLAAFSRRARNGLLRLSDACDIVNRHFDGEPT